MSEPQSNSREEYDKTLQYAKKCGYWAMYNAIAEDGYTDKVNWEELRSEKKQ